MKKPILLIAVILCSVFAMAACTTDASAFNRYEPESGNVWLFTSDNAADGNAVNNGKKVSLASAFKGGVKKPSGATNDVYINDVILGNDGRIYFLARYISDTFYNNYDTYACSVKFKGGDFRSHYVQKADVGNDLFTGLNIIGVNDGNLVVNIHNSNAAHSNRSNTIKILDINHKSKEIFSYTFNDVTSVLTSSDAMVSRQTIALACQKEYARSSDWSTFYKHDIYTITKSQAGFTIQSENDIDMGHVSTIDIYDEYAVFNMAEGSIVINALTGEKAYGTAADGIIDSKKEEYNDALKGLQKYEIIHGDIISVTRKSDGKNISFTFEELKETNEFIKILDETKVYPGGTACVGARVSAVVQSGDNIYLILQRNLGEHNSYVCWVNFDKDSVDYIGKIKATYPYELAILDGEMLVYGDGRIVLIPQNDNPYFILLIVTASFLLTVTVLSVIYFVRRKNKKVKAKANNGASPRRRLTL